MASGLCQVGRPEWVCTRPVGHNGPCPLWPVNRPRRLSCRLFGHDFHSKTLGIHGRWPSNVCRRCAYPKAAQEAK